MSPNRGHFHDLQGPSHKNVRVCWTLMRYGSRVEMEEGPKMPVWSVGRPTEEVCA